MPDPDWRTGHCCEFAAGHVFKVTGRDIWAEIGDCPRSPREAADLYRRRGVTSFADLVSQLFVPVEPSFAMRGDIAMVDGALGIVRGDLIEFMDRMQPIGRATCAWRLAKE